jgi:AAA15 family ATPase/GTPase
MMVEAWVMMQSLKINNFRGFDSFELRQLGRINLLVGENNSGKTSVLEAIQLLYSRTNLELLTQTMVERGEFLRLTEERRPGPGRDLDIRNLFHGHYIEIDESFSIRAMENLSEESLTAKVQQPARQQDLFEISEDNIVRDMELSLEWNFDRELEVLRIPLSIEGGISTDYNRRFRSKSSRILVAKTQFVSSSSLSISKMVEMFDQVVLKPEEDSIVQALKNIDITVERIASLGADRYFSDRYSPVKRGGFVIKRHGEEQPVPIGTMGDGIWRMLGLALAAVSTRDGVLLVDEIDTGLHFTTMIDMWRMILETARRLNVQVFATTHSRDCWESLASVAEAEAAQDDEIMLHRLEKGKSESVTFNPRQIEIAAERGIEVR